MFLFLFCLWLAAFIGNVIARRQESSGWSAATLHAMFWFAGVMVGYAIAT